MKPDVAIYLQNPVMRAQIEKAQAGEKKPLVQTHRPGLMNDLEERYANEVLQPLRKSGAIKVYLFEAIKLRLAINTHYTPDFFLVHDDDRMGFVEVKGWWREDARLKIKCAAEKYPFFLFSAATREDGKWKHEYFGAVEN